MKTVFVLLGLWFLTFGAFLNEFRQAAELRDQVAAATEAMNIMARQHEAEIDTLSQNQKRREPVHADTDKISARIERALKEYHSLANTPIPDSPLYSWENSDTSLD